MTSKQKKEVKELVSIVKNTTNHLNVMRIRLEEVGGDVFLDASTCGQALSEEVRLFNGGNDRLAEAEHVLLEALAFYGELLGDESLSREDDQSAALREASPPVGETATSPRPAVRRQRGEHEQEKARCETCKFCAFPRTPDDNNGACKCKLLRRKTIDIIVTNGTAPAWCPLNEKGGKA